MGRFRQGGKKNSLLNLNQRQTTHLSAPIYCVHAANSWMVQVDAKTR